MKDFFNQAIADGLNALGYSVDVPNEKGEMKFGPECHEVCTIAEKLNKLIESWPSVFSGESYNDKWIDCETMHTTKTAKLAFIEEIKKECPKHEPQSGWYMMPNPVKCKHCGIELLVEWREK
jgi:hypothetical protein